MRRPKGLEGREGEREGGLSTRVRSDPFLGGAGLVSAPCSSSRGGDTPSGSEGPRGPGGNGRGGGGGARFARPSPPGAAGVTRSRLRRATLN